MDEFQGIWKHLKLYALFCEHVWKYYYVFERLYGRHWSIKGVHDFKTTIMMIKTKTKVKIKKDCLRQSYWTLAF